MADYVKRGAKPFGARSGKPSFVKKAWGNSRTSDGPTTHFKATCSKCGDSCEVPFKPINGKPVFCRNCFVKTGDTSTKRAGDRYQKREYTPRTYEKSAPEASRSDNEVVRQLEAMNAKLDRLLQVMEVRAQK